MCQPVPCLRHRESDCDSWPLGVTLVLASILASAASFEPMTAVRSEYYDALKRRDFRGAEASMQGSEDLTESERGMRHMLRGNALKLLGRGHEAAAVEQYRRAVALSPLLYTAYNNLGVTLKELLPGQSSFETRCSDGVAALQTATRIAPTQPEPRNNLGLLYVKCGLVKAAIHVLQDAYDKTHNPVIAFNLALALHEAHQLPQAEQVLVDCLEGGHCPNTFSQPRMALSSMRYMRGQRHESLALLQTALRYRPSNSLGWAHFAHVLSSVTSDTNSTQRAFRAAGEALRLDPNSTIALIVRGTILGDSRMHGAAAAHFRAVRRIEPSNLEAKVSHGYYEILNCDWGQRKQHRSNMRSALDQHTGHQAFPVNAVWVAAVLELGPRYVLLAAQRVAQQVVGPHGLTPERSWFDLASLRSAARLGVGYLSSDFGNHPVRHAINSVLELHDRSRFAVFAYALQNNADATRWNGQHPHATLRVLGQVSDEDSATLIAADKIHVLLDMNGYTLNHRSRIPHFRPAPARMTLIGDNKSLGGSFVSYICVDRLTAPPSASAWYSERLVMLPFFYHGNSHRHINALGTAPAPQDDSATGQLAISSSVWVLEGFNRVEKLCPSTLSMWIQILHRLVSSSCALRLLADPPSAVAPLTSELKARGVNPSGSHVHTLNRGSRAEYLARVARADVALDSTVANGEMTNLDMMWLGPVPLVTMPGSLLMDRFGLMTLYNLGVHEHTAVRTRKEYEDIVVGLR